MMHRVLCIGGKCADCGGHIELRVVSLLEKYNRWAYSAGGFVCGGIFTCLI